VDFDDDDDDDDADEFAIDTLYRLVDEYPDGERARCRMLFRLVAGCFEERLDALHVTSLSLPAADIHAETPLWKWCVDEFERLSDDDFDHDEKYGYLNRLCAFGIRGMPFNHDTAKFLLRAYFTLEMQPEKFLSILRQVFPESRAWR
jgi:hypothetical protein